MARSVFIVEDEYIIAEDLRTIVEQLGYRVVGHSMEASDALVHIKKSSPDLVLLDIRLEGTIDGIALAKILNEKHNVPFIFITSHADPRTLEGIKATHPLGYVLKPFDQRDLYVALNIGFSKITNEKLLRENQYLQEEIQLQHDRIIGNSVVLQHTLTKVTQVAPTDMTVLIQGETGTGKELIARAVHELSDRRKKPLVKINCAALPTELIESELFGHEQGAFTGATQRRIGKFELAHRGTIFLDEIGELPLALQAKLLRAIQEKEIERLGGNQTLHLDVRVMAATNRRLATEVDQGRFRSDLFYRLNVFPIDVPPLRDRPEDIPLLATHFLQKATKKVGRAITHIDKRALQQLSTYPWPGNIRELEHVIDRAVILAASPTLQVTDLNLHPQPVPDAPSAFMPLTYADAERKLILDTLHRCGRRIRGTDGAAEMLAIPPSTLESRMKRLGIERTFK